MENLTIVEYQSQRVLTTEQLAQAYGCSEGNIKVNYSSNKKRFEEGKHYFKLEGYELKEFKNNRVSISNSVENKPENFQVVGKNAKSLYLWTKRGASRHCKMLGTDKAWEMFDILEENYFNPKPAVSAAPYVLIPKFFRGKQVITIKDAAVILNVSRALIEEVINKPTANLHEGQDYYRLKGDKRAEFKHDNPSIPAVVHHIIAILKSGFEKICEYLKIKEIPEIFTVKNLAVELGLMPKALQPQQVQAPPQQPKSQIEQIRDDLINAQKIVMQLYKIYDRVEVRDSEALGRVANILNLFVREKSFYIAPAK